ncbi:ABC transporter ATP-binding protein [Shouchella shacheensis]|uniref:ABC transporter ATP-binding protein n=1 Tax=Shouchella shacheensis TaxID=1649580 RepID=UPI00073FB572|nr:ABC transporter ATP-binding protein [Shouchella shacheensis]
MIVFDGVAKEFADGTRAAHDLQFSIEKGEFFVLIGPSGCGKTTTLKMINRLIEPTSGTISINGTNAAEQNIHALRWNIGYVLQQIALFPNMTVAENIAVVPEMKKWNQNQIKARVDELLTLVGMAPDSFRDRMPNDLSGGQQQRIGVARALAADPGILLMDEPFSALDPITREQLQNDIKDLQETIQKTIVFVTHDIDEAAKLGDRLCLMKEGSVVQIGSASELRDSPASDFVRDFIGSSDKSMVALKEVMAPSEESKYVKNEWESEEQMLQYVTNHQNELVQAIYNGVILDDPLTLPHSSSIKEAFAALQSQGVPAIPVHEQNKIIGTVSYEELARLAVDA